jgi:hypothetical protein
MQANAAEVAPSKLIGEMDGVYKHRFKSATIEPRKAPGEADAPYQAEDIIEIVRYDDRHVYVSANSSSTTATRAPSRVSQATKMAALFITARKSPLMAGRHVRSRSA